MVSGKRPNISRNEFYIFNFLFTVKNVAFGYSLCHHENCLYFLYFCFKIVTRKSVISTINWNIEKNTTLNTKSLKRGTKRINMKMT